MVISALVCAFMLFVVVYFMGLLGMETVRAVILHVNAQRTNRHALR